MTEAAQQENNITRLAEAIEQEALSKNQINYLSVRVVALREKVLQLQAALNEALQEVKRLSDSMPEEVDGEDLR